MMQRTPICPKCGYDQSGEISTWESSCPVEGRCPECGFGFAWADVMDPARVELKWYIEHAKSKRGIVRRTPSTLWKLLIPSRYWREIGVHSRIRHRALIYWLALLGLCLHVIAIVPVAMSNWEEGIKWSGIQSVGDYFEVYGVWGFVYELHNAIASPFFKVEYDIDYVRYEYGTYFHQGVFGFNIAWVLPLVLSTSWLVIMLAVPTTRKLVNLRKAHVNRAWTLSLISVVIISELLRIVSGFSGWSNGGTIEKGFQILFIVVYLYAIIWIECFWISAMRVGWGIRPSWHLSLLGLICSLLAGSIVIVSGLYY